MYNEVESNPLAYTIAASMAFRDACVEAGLVLMEPCMDLEIITPTDNAGDVMSDLNSRRGRVLAMDPKK